MTYRSDLEALSARRAALEAEVRAKTRELDEARRLVTEHEQRKLLPVLDNIRVAAPCTARWDAMIGDDVVRHCVECKKNVYNLSGMTRDDAEAMLRARNGELCVRYYQRADGTILTSDCDVGAARRTRTRRIAAVGVAASLAGAAIGLPPSHHLRADRVVEGVTLGQVRAAREAPMPVMGLVLVDERPPALAPEPARPAK
jgi:hypothetical protein